MLRDYGPFSGFRPFGFSIGSPGSSIHPGLFVKKEGSKQHSKTCSSFLRHLFVDSMSQDNFLQKFHDLGSVGGLDVGRAGIRALPIVLELPL